MMIFCEWLMGGKGVKTPSLYAKLALHSLSFGQVHCKVVKFKVVIIIIVSEMMMRSVYI
ncbi:MAG: hypothetical protein J7J01_09425 [Methanophagales archaeon]|nr:hypothetical protein [Methanophagales archaeon]